MLLAEHAVLAARAWSSSARIAVSASRSAMVTGLGVALVVDRDRRAEIARRDRPRGIGEAVGQSDQLGEEPIPAHRQCVLTGR